MQLLSETVDFTRTSILILKIRELLKDRDVTEALETVLRKLDVSMRRSAGFGQQQIWIAFAAAHSVTPWLGIEAQLTACLARENLGKKMLIIFKCAFQPADDIDFQIASYAPRYLIFCQLTMTHRNRKTMF